MWQRIAAHLKDELAQAREANDGFQDQQKTERLRGRIACLKELIAAGEVATTEPEEDADGGE